MRGAPCTLDDLRAAPEAFIASTMREVMPIAAIDDSSCPSAPGPVTPRPRRRSAAHRATSCGRSVRSGATAVARRTGSDVPGRWLTPPHALPISAASGPILRHADDDACLAPSSATGRSSSRRRPSRRRCASATRRCSSTPASTTTTSSRAVFFDELGAAAPEHQLELGGGSNTRADRRACSRRSSRCCAEPSARRGARLRRHELDARRRAGRRPGRHPGRARRGRHALVRPRDAGGAQPRAHRPRLRPAAVLDRDRGREPRAARASRGERRRWSAT